MKARDGLNPTMMESSFMRVTGTETMAASNTTTIGTRTTTVTRIATTTTVITRITRR